MSIISVKSASRLPAHRSFLERATLASLSLVLSLTTFSLPSSATTLFYKSFNDLMKEADGVVAGHVVSVNSQYSANKEIYTFVTLDQLEVLSGSYQSSTLTLRLKGGKVENDISHVIGSPEFNEGERVVLFLNGNGKNMVPLVGWTQGVFRIEQDAATSTDVVKDAEGNRVLSVQNGQVLRDQIAQPEAMILKQTSGAAASQNQYEGGAGTSDSKQGTTDAVTPQTQTNAMKSAPSMNAAAFRALVKNSAALRESKASISSVRVMDFSVPNANLDTASEGSPAAKKTVEQSAPVAPKRSDVPVVKDQQ